MIPGLSWINIGAGAIGAFILAWALHTLNVDRIEAKHRLELSAQETALNEKCDKDKLITKGANDGLQKQINDIAGKLAVAKRLHTAHCVTASEPTNASASGREHAGQNGISSDWLRDYAAECETYRQERITLETFIDNERQ